MHCRDKEKSKGAHKSEKMKATESSRTDGKRKKAAVSPKCTKCEQAHKTRECMYMQTSKRKPKKDNACAEADSIFELFSNYRQYVVTIIAIYNVVTSYLLLNLLCLLCICVPVGLPRPNAQSSQLIAQASQQMDIKNKQDNNQLDAQVVSKVLHNNQNINY